MQRLPHEIKKKKSIIQKEELHNDQNLKINSVVEVINQNIVNPLTKFEKFSQLTYQQSNTQLEEIYKHHPHLGDASDKASAI